MKPASDRYCDIAVKIILVLYPVLLRFIVAVVFPVMICRRLLYGAGDRFYLMWKSRVFPVLPEWTNPAEKKVFWIHGASVGEMDLALNIIKANKEAGKENLFFVTCGTPEGMKKILPHPEAAMMQPLDTFGNYKKILKTIAPSELWILETDYWPVMCLKIGKMIPTRVIQARISERKVRKIKIAVCMLKAMLKNMNPVFTVSENAAERLGYLGVPEHRIILAPSFKFMSVPTPKERDRAIFSENAGYHPEKQKLAVFGSVQPAEITHLAEALKILTDNFGEKIHFAIIPRQPEAAKKINKVCKNLGLKTAVSGYPVKTTFSENIIIYSGFGFLCDFYYHADVCFVGGSFSRRGGQNMVEPLFFDKPVFVGPHTPNFEAEMEILTEKGYVSRASSGKELGVMMNKALKENNIEGLPASAFLKRILEQKKETLLSYGENKTF